MNSDIGLLGDRKMTADEKRIITDIESDEFRHIRSSDIAELMKMCSKTEGKEKIGNVLFEAITKAFALGYYRGKRRKQN